MKYKINNLIIDGKSRVEASKIAKLFSKCKDSVKDAILTEGKTYTTKSGNKLTVKKVISSYDEYSGNPDIRIYYDYEKVDGKKGSSQCGTNDFFKMMKDSIKDSYYTAHEKADKEFVKMAISEMSRYINNWSFMTSKQKRDIGSTLSELKARVEELKAALKDSIINDDQKKYRYYFVPDDYYGQHGTDIFEIYLTKEEADKIGETRIYNNKRGFLTNSYRSALYYVQD